MPKGQHCCSPWQLLAPINYNCYTNTFSFDRPVTVNCPILVMEKMKTVRNINRCS